MPKPFAVLQYLVDRPGTLITHEQLLAAIWPDTYVQPEVLRRYILEIRRVLGDTPDAPRFVRTVPRRGYQFIAPVADDLAGPAEENADRVTRLVGRESALAELRHSLASALNGRRQLTFVVGEPGIGKTSLVDAFQSTCASTSGVTVVRGQSVEGFGGKEAYYPLLEAIGQLAHGSRRAVVVETLAAMAPTWLVQFASLIRPEQRAALQRETVGVRRDRMVRELCEALEVITRTMPLVLILEDLHWVDHPTIDVLSLLARRREAARLLVIGTLRPAELILTESPLKTLKHDLVVHHLAHELNLERLQKSDVAAYVAGVFAPGDLPHALATVIYRRSDGNPLFMVAMLDHLAKRGILAQADGRWTLTKPLDLVDPEVPETLKQMLELQLQNASEPEQLLLKAASVAGQQFTVSALSTMLEEDATRIEEECEALVARQQFLGFSETRTPSNDVPTAEYRFTHALYREVVYRRLSPTQRLSFHRRLAFGLEARRSPVEAEAAAEIALHFEEGHEHKSAIKYLMLAAQNATRRYAHEQAVAVLEHARSLIDKIARDDRDTLELQILEAIGNAYYAMGNMQQSARVYEAIAIAAFEAGDLAAQADALMRRPYPAEVVPFFLKAIELDPDFVSAYTTLSRIFSNIGESLRAQEFAALAYQLRDRVGERERLSITYQYHYEVTGDQVRAAETLETWKCRFPLEFQPVNSLALLHNFLGDFPRAIEEGKEAVRRNPSHSYPYSNLAHAYRGAGAFMDAKRTAEEAVARGIETLPTRRLLFQLAVLAGDHKAAEQHRQWARDKPREFDMIGAHAQMVGWSGKVRQSRMLYQDAAQLAERRNLPDVGSSHLAWGLAMELAYGNDDAAAELARRILDRRPSYDPRLRAAMILGATGSGDDAEAIANELARANPDHTLINFVLVPLVKASVALGRQDPSRAVAELAVSAPYELGFIGALAPVYLRAQSYLLTGASGCAAAEFQRILDHRGSDPFSPFHAVAILGLARAYSMAGRFAESRGAYEQFFGAWNDADPDVTVLVRAKQECDRLQLAIAGAQRVQT
jgi:DNA-binding winged helix-turn-helix (wHTH) protein/tetratricopeptide (TPR) repeat protein